MAFLRVAPSVSVQVRDASDMPPWFTLSDQEWADIKVALLTAIHEQDPDGWIEDRGVKYYLMTSMLDGLGNAVGLPDRICRVLRACVGIIVDIDADEDADTVSPEYTNLHIYRDKDDRAMWDEWTRIERICRVPAEAQRTE